MDLLRHIYRIDLPPAARDEIAIERLVQLNKHQLVGAIAGAANPLLLAAAVWRPDEALFLLGWCLAGLLFSAIQIRAWQRNRRKPRPKRPPRRLTRRVMQGAVILGAYWGLFGMVMVPGASPSEVLLISLSVCAMGVGGAMALALVPAAAGIFFLLTYLPQAAALYVHYEDMPFAFGVLVFVFLVFVSLVILRMHRTFVDAIAAAVQNRQLALEARAADTAKSQFIANMSHELRTPLNAILGYSEMMTLEMLGPLGGNRYRDYARYINDSGGHLLALVNDMIDISRIEAGQVDLAREPVEVGPLLRECLDLFSQRAVAAGIVFRADCIAPVVMNVDRRAIRQMLFNLLSNAIKFSPKGGEIAVSARATADGSVTLSVSDPGIGMSGEEISVALSRFGKVANALVSNAGGAGLGLPLSQQLAALHGGQLRITSAPGAGTRVDIELPAGTVADAPAANGNAAPADGAAALAGK